jgi:polar amino acid transport system permease protein/polar amino acid transport system substrate-binding protein
MEFLYENFFKNGAYQPLLDGLKVTLAVTLAAFIIGILLGAVLCAMARSGNKVLKAVSRSFIILIRGTPVLLLLMLFYYVILAPIKTDALITSFIAFGLNTAAHIGEIMISSLESVDKVQIEAARSQGFTMVGAFFTVQFPQAMRYGIGVLENTLINLLQWTTVVGYISLSDVTRIVNNMGSRTGKPFAALAIGIIIYLLISVCFHGLFRLFQICRKDKEINNVGKAVIKTKRTGNIMIPGSKGHGFHACMKFCLACRQKHDFGTRKIIKRAPDRADFE